MPQLYAVGASCLLRDNQQCVVSRGRAEAEPRTRPAQDSEDNMDIDETLLRTEPTDQFEPLEIAHILPRSLATITADTTELVKLIYAYPYYILMRSRRATRRMLLSSF